MARIPAPHAPSNLGVVGNVQLKGLSEYQAKLARTWARIRSGEIDTAQREERAGRENAWKEAE